MSTQVPLPALGESVTEGTISRWLKQVGDRVEVDEPIVEVSTDKVDTEIPSPAAGVILELKYAEDDVVPVGEVLAVIGDEGEAPAEGGDSGGEEAAQAPEPAPAPEEEPSEPKPLEEEVPSTEASVAEEQPAPSAGGGAASGTEVTLPQLGESVTEGTVSRWLKSVGDTVEVDEPLLEVSTDKVDTEVPSPVAGTLLEIKFNEDDVAPVGAVLCIVGDANAQPAEQEAAPAPEAAEVPADQPEAENDESMNVDTVEEQADAGDEGGQEPIPTPVEEAPKQEAPKEDAPKPAAPAAPAAAPRHAADSSDEGVYVTPLVRKLAAEHGVDLASLQGTGVGGRIRKQDVIAAAEAAKKAAEEEAKKAEEAAKAPAAPAPAAKAAPAASAEDQAKKGTTEKMSRLRATIAKRMVESLQVAAQLTATVEVDLTNISKLRGQVKDDFKKRNGASLSYLPFIAKVAVECLQQFPIVNATIDTEAGTITYADAEHLGIAVDTPKGLLVPVIKDAGDLNIAGIAKKIADLAARTRENKVTPDELGGGTFTITNYGSAGTLMDTPIINQPQVAILGTGALVKRPMVIKDDALGEVIAVRDMMYLSMSYDHRLIDGAVAARFLSAMKARLEEGDFGAEFGV